MEGRKGASRPANGKLAKRSCHSCNLRKRKCTRDLPACRLCVRNRRSCSYQFEHANAGKPSQPETRLEAAAVEKPVLRNEFPAAFYLDPKLFNCCAPQGTPRSQLSVPPEATELLGDSSSRKVLAAEYFQIANRWMPIISRIRFYGSLTDPLQSADPGVTAVLLAMKLVLSGPETANECSETYTTLKAFQLRMEMAGFVTIATIQSAILTAMYELGHAIFPSVYTTVSTCARYLTALSIEGTTSVQGKQWIELEERNRIWWAVVILDRSTNLGFLGRDLCKADPHSDSILPMDDDAWDQGVLPEDPTQTVFSTPSLNNGRYARLAQAVNLLSQVFRHIPSRGGELRLDMDIIAQLERTFFALENLAAFEERERKICCLSSIATCYSSILLLRTTYLSQPQEVLTEDGIKQSQHAIREVLTKTLGHFQRFRDGWGSLEKFPPLALDWLYRAAVAHLMLAPDPAPNDCDKVIDELKVALKFVSQRWRAATYYIRFLETRQAVKIPSH